MIVILDIETKELVPENRELSGMHVSVAGALVEGEVLFYFEHDLDVLFALLDRAELIVGHNLLRFDYLVLQQYAKFDVRERYASKTFDLQHLLLRKTDRLIGLNDLAQRNLGMMKAGSGKDAPLLFQEGKIADLKVYLEQDLVLTMRLFNLIREQGKLKVGIIYYKEAIEREVLISADER